MPTHGDGPSYLRRTGSYHAPLWSAECLTCDGVLTWHRLISEAMTELAEHVAFSQLGALEGLDSRCRSVRAERRLSYYAFRDGGQTADAAALLVGVSRKSGVLWDAERVEAGAA